VGITILNSRAISMSMRKGLSDVIIEDDIVRIVMDLSGIEKEEIDIKILIKDKLVSIKHGPTKSILEIKIPVKIKDDFVWTFNNGVLDVEIKR
jgi:HSP20 family molecular chaperone IbpA